MSRSDEYFDILIKDPSTPTYLVNKLITLRRELAMDNIVEFGQMIDEDNARSLYWFQEGIKAAYPEDSCLLDRDILLREADEGHIGPLKKE